MQRRDFCRSVLGTATGLAFGAHAADTVDTDTTRGAFAARRATAPWTLGYVGLQADAPPMALTLRGRLPAGLAGAFYRNGTGRHEVGGLRYHHPFDGDGLVQKYSVSERGIVHHARFVATDKAKAEAAAGRPLRQAFGTAFPGAEPVNSADALNVANTSVVHHGGELLALWEGGSATRLDAQDLATLGPKQWSREYAGMPFSAHPKLDTDGSLWNFGISSAAGLLSVYHVAPGGSLAKAVTVPVPELAMVHDFAITERFLVFLLPPLVFEGSRMQAGASFLDSHVWKPQLGLRVLVLDKATLATPQWFELPAGFVFHVGNACEDRGLIRLDCVRSPTAWHATTGLRELMQGRYEPREFAAYMLIELDLQSRKASQTVLPLLGEFPRVDTRVVGRRYDQVYGALRLAPGDRPGYDAVMRMDVHSGRLDRYRYGADVMVEEHIFVPRPGRSDREGDGWLVGTALDLSRQQMLFSVFDARQLSAGPIAQATMERPMPLGLHAIFVPG